MGGTAPTTQTWESCYPEGVPEGRLFNIGGATSSVEDYVAMEQRWVSVPNMPRAIRGDAAVALDGRLLVIGGVDGFCCAFCSC